MFNHNNISKKNNTFIAMMGQVDDTYDIFFSK